jgi:hypothetical protein
LEGSFFRFVILHHTGWITGNRGDHWDWLMEPPRGEPSGLMSWASDRDPALGWIGSDLEPLPRHRVEYLDYEGPISRGRGQVRRIATGRIRWRESTPKSLRFDLIDVEFLERPFVNWPLGRYCVTWIANLPSSRWRLIWTENGNADESISDDATI